MSDILEQHCLVALSSLSLDEAHLLLNKVFSRCQSVLPGLSGISGKCGQFVSSFGDLRASVAEAFKFSRVTSPSVSVADFPRPSLVHGNPWALKPEMGLNLPESLQAKRHTRVPACLCPNDPWKRNFPVMPALSAGYCQKNFVKKRRQLRALRVSAGGTSSSFSSSSSTFSSSTA